MFSSALVALVATGCAELPEASGAEDEIAVEGHEDALIACKAALLTATPAANLQRRCERVRARMVGACWWAN